MSSPNSSNLSGKFQSVKVYDGFSTVFRQWRAEGTHCKQLHGYGVSFTIWFEGDLDEKNWVFDFGGMKRAKSQIDGMNPNEWFKYMFDHTTIVAEDDPYLEHLRELHLNYVINLRVLPYVGAERFAEFIYHKINEFVQEETKERVRVKKVEFREHGKNSAIYEN